ncbi:MAG: hypothetical protein AAGJ32_11120 [Pseudomonadota bacterium]
MLAEIAQTGGKAVLTAVFIIFVSEVAKRSTMLAALLVALPLATMLTVAMTYYNTRNAALATKFATSTAYLIVPGLMFFIALPLAQRNGVPFVAAFALATGLTLVAYAVWFAVLHHFGIEL